MYLSFTHLSCKYLPFRHLLSRQNCSNLASRFFPTFALALALLLSVAQQAHATQHALLVAVSNYPNLPESASLRGPANDVVMVEQVLSQWGFKADNMQVLSEAQADEQKPTRANILAAFDRLIENAKADDFVFIHMAGHGTQVPATEATIADEPDGLDELFLPRDVSGWGGAGDSGEGVTNAIQDDEVGDRLALLRAKGAKIWIIFDSCHSGTMTRSVMDGDVVLRRLSPEILGIPAEAMRKAEASAISTRGSSNTTRPRASGLDVENDPGIIQFFAAQTHQEAPEMALPRGGEKRYGLFTYSLMSALSSGEPMSYRQLAQHVQGRYRSLPYNSATPEFRGDLDEGVFAGTAGEFHASAKAVDGELVIQAGELQRFSEGALVALLKKSTDDISKARGYARITRASALQSHAQPEAYDDLEAMDLSAMFGSVYARMVEPAFSPTLRMAMLPSGREHFVERNQTVEQALLAATEDADSPLGRIVELGPTTQGADFLLFAEPLGEDASTDSGTRIYFLTPDQPLFCGLQSLADDALEACRDAQKNEQWTYIDVPTATSDDASAPVVEAMLSASLRISRAFNLLRIASDGILSDGEIETRFLVQKKSETSPQQRFDYEGIALSPGDAISLHAINTDGQSAFTAHIFFISSQWEITSLRQINLAPGAEQTMPLGKVQAGSMGREQLLVIAEKRGNASVAKSFSYLAQPGLAAANSRDLRLRSVATAASPHSPLDALLRAARGDIQTRGFGNDSAAKGVQVFGWETVAE